MQPETTRGPIRQNLDPARFAAATGLAVLPVVVEATAAPIPDDGLVRAWPAPDFGVDTHRIYMVQWYAFALLAAAPVALVPSPARLACRRRPTHDQRYAAGGRARTVAASARRRRIRCC